MSSRDELHDVTVAGAQQLNRRLFLEQAGLGLGAAALSALGMPSSLFGEEAAPLVQLPGSSPRANGYWSAARQAGLAAR